MPKKSAHPAHVAPTFGLPYAAAHVTASGRYAVTCPVCGTECVGDAPTSEDAATKSAGRVYAAHFTTAVAIDAALIRYVDICVANGTVDDVLRALADGEVAEIAYEVAECCDLMPSPDDDTVDDFVDEMFDECAQRLGDLLTAVQS